jgi:hypothetical protein
MKKMQLCLWALAWCAWLTVPAWGDGPSRPATAAEKAYALRTLTAVSQALPQPLPGFQVVESTPLSPVERVSPGVEAAPMPLDYTVSWLNPEQAAKERAAEDAALSRAAAQVNAPAAQARQKALADRLNKTAAEYGRALEKHDQAKAAALQKEMEAIGRELTQQGQAQNAVLKNETKGLTQRSRLTIWVRVNDFSIDQPARLAKDLGPVSGNLGFAFHDDEGKFEDHLLVMIGPWKSRQENQQVIYEASQAARPHTQAQTLTVTVRGDPALARQALSKVAWKALQALIK